MQHKIKKTSLALALNVFISYSAIFMIVQNKNANGI